MAWWALGGQSRLIHHAASAIFQGKTAYAFVLLQSNSQAASHLFYVNLIRNVYINFLPFNFSGRPNQENTAREALKSPTLRTPSQYNQPVAFKASPRRDSVVAASFCMTAQWCHRLSMDGRTEITAYLKVSNLSNSGRCWRE